MSVTLVRRVASALPEETEAPEALALMTDVVAAEPDETEPPDAAARILIVIAAEPLEAEAPLAVAISAPPPATMVAFAEPVDVLAPEAETRIVCVIAAEPELVLAPEADPARVSAGSRLYVYPISRSATGLDVTVPPPVPVAMPIAPAVRIPLVSPEVTVASFVYGEGRAKAGFAEACRPVTISPVSPPWSVTVGIVPDDAATTRGAPEVISARIPVWIAPIPTGRPAPDHVTVRVASESADPTGMIQRYEDHTVPLRVGPTTVVSAFVNPDRSHVSVPVLVPEAKTRTEPSGMLDGIATVNAAVAVVPTEPVTVANTATPRPPLA